MSKFIDETCDNAKLINQRAYDLAQLSDSFYHTGNAKIGKLLIEISMDLFEAEKAIRKAMSEEVNRQCKQAEKFSATVVKAALAGAIIHKSEEQP